MTILQILLRRWWLVLIPAIITTALAVPDFLNRRATSGGYAASLQYTAFQSIDTLPRDGDYQDLWLSSELLINAFTDWVQGSSFEQELTAVLGDRADVSLLSVHADNGRSLGVINFSHPDAAQLEAIVTAAVTVMQTRSQNYYAQLGGEPATVTIIDRSPVVPAPPPITDRFAPFIRIGLGLLSGIGLAFLAHYLDPVVRQREEVESLGLQVIATIPK